MMENPILKDIEWASLLDTLASGYDGDYARAMDDLDKYRPFEQKIQEGDPKPGKIIIDFLHKWHTQGVPNKSDKELTVRIKKNAKELDSLYYVSLHDVTSETVKRLFEGFSSPSIPGFGPTARTKTLHLLRPKTFVMWDEKIIGVFTERLKEKGKGDIKGSQMYVEFIKEMNKFSKNVLNDTTISSLNALLKKLSKANEKRFYKKTEAKIIDEYNRLTKTRNAKVSFKLRTSDCIRL
jgi:hypothetical protein